MAMACEQEEGCLCLTKKKKERLNFFVQTQGTVRQGKRKTHAPGREFWFPTFQAGKSRWNWHSTMRQTLSLFFFLFFSLFLCCGQDRWQARTIFRGPLVLIVQCSYWNLYTRQSRILGVQKKSLMVD